MGKRIIITGGPGSGKTTLINHLKKKGFATEPEVSRKVIHDYGCAPWDGIERYTKLAIEEYKKQMDREVTHFVYTDRGIPDLMANQWYYKGKFSFGEFQFHKYYHREVYILPPWKEIYRNDSERPETFEESIALYHCLVRIYVQLGFRVLQLPRVGINERSELIVQNL